MVEVAEVESLDSLREAVTGASKRGLPVAIAGGRHAMGGQQFCEGGLLVDTRRLARILDFDRDGGLLELEAGIQWPAILGYLQESQRGARPAWSFAQKQTGVDRLSLGGAIAANAHGRASR